jgi:hypothetical protein
MSDEKKSLSAGFGQVGNYAASNRQAQSAGGLVGAGPKTLLEDLMSRREQIEWQIANLAALEKQAADLDRAIAALHPPVDSGGGDESETLVEVQTPLGFTKWAGGECPVDQEASVEVVYRNGERPFRLTGAVARALDWSWCAESARFSAHDIIAYRIIPAPDTTTQNADLEAPPIPALETSEEGEDTFTRLTETPGETPLVSLDFETGEITESDPPTGPAADVVALQTYMDGDELVVREITADEFYQPPPVDVTPTKPTEYRDLAHYLGEKVLEEADPKQRISIFGIEFGGKPKVEA